MTHLQGTGAWAFLCFSFFFFMLELRGLSIRASSAEKFMDHAFLVSIMRVISPRPVVFSGEPSTSITSGTGCLARLGSSRVLSPCLQSRPAHGARQCSGWHVCHGAPLNRLRWLPLLTFLVVNPSFIWQGDPENSRAVLWDSTHDPGHHSRISGVLVRMGRSPCPCCLSLQPGLPPSCAGALTHWR